MTLAETLNTAAYQAAHDGAALAADHAGMLWMHDRDRAALLNRLSTNNVAALQPGQGRQTVLTTPIGRIIDLLTIHVFADDLLLVTSPGQQAAVRKHLRKNIFFNDKVKVEPVEELGRLLLYGPQAEPLLGTLGAVPAAELYALTPANIDGVALHISRVKPIGGAGFALYAPAAQLATIQAALHKADAVDLDATSLDVLRIEAGYPAFGRELSQDYIPLETGLWEAVCFTKGCYVGQEIIARMESRNRIAKQLRGLHLHIAGDQAAELAAIKLPATLSAEGKPAGELTSATISPRYGSIGLAYVRSAQAVAGTQLSLAEGQISAEVVDLPFA
jgi:tRNA-modifying protein YgfZ